MHDKFVGPIPKGLDEGARALHSLVPRLFDSKVAMTRAMEAGMRFPRAVLGDAHQWLRHTFPAPPPPPSPQKGAVGGGKGGATEATATTMVQPEGTPNSVESPTGEANGKSASNGDATATTAAGFEAGAGGKGEGEADSEASATAAAAAAERSRQGWDAVFAPGFEDCYKGGGKEHEVCVCFFYRSGDHPDYGGDSLHSLEILLHTWGELSEHVWANIKVGLSPASHDV